MNLRPLLDRPTWLARAELANTIFQGMEALYNLNRRHRSLGYLSPVEFENLFTAATEAA